MSAFFIDGIHTTGTNFFNNLIVGNTLTNHHVNSPYFFCEEIREIGLNINNGALKEFRINLYNKLTSNNRYRKNIFLLASRYSSLAARYRMSTRLAGSLQLPKKS